jgi:hypothetical protein
MSYGEFCKQIAPSVLELQKECSKMSEVFRHIIPKNCSILFMLNCHN